MSAPGIHASCVAIAGQGVLLMGPSGCGKSTLALTLMEREAVLVADDRVMLSEADGRLHASPHPNLQGMLEIYGIGITRWKYEASAPVAMAVEHGEAERLPDMTYWKWAKLQVPLLRLDLDRHDTARRIIIALALIVKNHSLSPVAGLVGKVS